MIETDVAFDLASYVPIFLYLFFIIGFAVTSLILAHVIGPRRKVGPYEAVKLMPYESGMDPIGPAHKQFDVKYYLVAIMFLVFDVELLFLYPWAVSAFRAEPYNWLPSELRPTIFWAVVVFIGLLGLAYLYDFRKGVFRWR